VLRRCVI